MLEGPSEHQIAHGRDLQGHMMASLRLGEAEKLLNPQAPQQQQSQLKPSVTS